MGVASGAWEDTITEAADDAKDFDVRDFSRLEYNFADKIRHLVERISGGGIVKTPTRASSPDEIVADQGSGGRTLAALAAHRSLCIFRRERQPHLIAEILGNPEPVLPGPTETDVVLPASMVMGSTSVRLSTPFFVSVTKLHICPPVKLQPLLSAAWPHICRCRKL